MRLNLKENIEFPFSDPDWALKLLKTSIAYILGLTAPAVFGYQLAVIRQTANGEDETMPEFSSNNFGKLWMQGFVYCLMLFCLMFLPMIAVGMMTYGACMSMEDSSAVMGVVITGVFIAMALVMILCVVIPALMLRYAMTEQVSSLLDIRSAISDMKHGPGDYALIFFFPMLASIVTTMVSATGIGAILVFPLTILILIIQGRMLGNYYRAYFQ